MMEKFWWKANLGEMGKICWRGGPIILEEKRKNRKMDSENMKENAGSKYVEFEWEKWGNKGRGRTKLAEKVGANFGTFLGPNNWIGAEQPLRWSNLWHTKAFCAPLTNAILAILRQFGQKMKGDSFLKLKNCWKWKKTNFKMYKMLPFIKSVLVNELMASKSNVQQCSFCSSSTLQMVLSPSSPINPPHPSIHFHNLPLCHYSILSIHPRIVCPPTP